MKPILATLKLRNNRLIKMREKRGLKASEVAVGAGISHAAYCRLESMGVSPFRKRDGHWLPTVLKIAEFYNCLPAYLFPSVVAEMPEVKIERELDAEDLIYLESGESTLLLTSGNPAIRSEGREEIELALGEMDPRDRTVLEMLVLTDNPTTLDAAGEAIGVSRERCRQIKTRAARRLAQKLTGVPEQRWSDDVEKNDKQRRAYNRAIKQGLIERTDGIYSECKEVS